MLGIDHPHGRHWKAEPGTDSAFLDGSGEVCFQGLDRQEVYRWVNRTLRPQDYSGLKPGMAWYW